MGCLIRLTTIPMVKHLVRGRWSTTLKVGGGNSLHYIFMQGWITEDPSQAKRGYLLYSRGLPRSYRESLYYMHGVIHHSYIKWCHDGVILHHNSSIEYINSFYVPMTSCCIVITNCIMCQLFEYNEMKRFLTDCFMWKFIMFALISIMLLLKLYYNIIVYNWDCIIIEIRQKSPLS